MQSFDVLPVLLEQGNKEIHSDLNVGIDLLLSHVYMCAGNTEGEHFLQLELHGAFDSVDLFHHVLCPLNQCWELAKLVHGRSQKTRNLLHDGTRSQEEAVFVCELLDFLFVFVEGFQSLNIKAINTVSLGLLNVEGITKHAARQTLARDVWELDGASETLVFLCVVVLQDNLELNRLDKFALLLL